MSIAHVSNRQATGGSDTHTAAAVEACSVVAAKRTHPRVTPPFAFEAEEFHSQFPDEDWRLRLGLPQTLEFPSARN
jgi:hypothetical protein